MKRIIISVLTVVLFFTFTLPTFAAGNVIYEKDAGDFVFEYGSEHSATDLFSDFKSVMPGDSITQVVTVKNYASHKAKVKIYMRSLGAHEKSDDFLSQLSLRVKRSEDNTMAYMFDAAANETADLTDWVLLGTLYSGGEVNLDVTLDVPTTITNKYADEIGFLDWQFKVEEFPIESSDPKPPQTGDTSNAVIWISVLILSAAMTAIFFIILLAKKRKDSKNA